MRSQTYGDKQREAQRRKKQEELRQKKTNTEGVPTADIPRNSDKSDLAPKINTKDTPGPRSS
jgi:hypothetical protein